MSRLLIRQYLNQLALLKRISGSSRESVVREAFKDLLKGWGRQHDLVFISEHEIAAPTKERRCYVSAAPTRVFCIMACAHRHSSEPD